MDDSFFLLHDLLDDLSESVINMKGLYNVVIRPVVSISREMLIITRTTVSDGGTWSVKDTLEEQVYHQLLHCDYLFNRNSSFNKSEYTRLLYRLHLLYTLEDRDEDTKYSSDIVKMTEENLITYIYQCINNTALSVTLNDESVVTESKRFYLRNLKDVNAMMRVLESINFDDEPQRDEEKPAYWNTQIGSKVSTTINMTRSELRTLKESLENEYGNKRNTFMNALLNDYS